MKRKRELNPILVDLLWKLGVLLALMAFSMFSLWVGSILHGMGW
jgi:hypothetical protein